jgi:hypothetical protein
VGFAPALEFALGQICGGGAPHKISQGFEHPAFDGEDSPQGFLQVEVTENQG